MTEAELHGWLNNPLWRAQLDGLVAEEASESRRVAVWAPGVATLVVPPPVAGAAAATVLPMEPVSRGLAPWRRKPRSRHRSRIRRRFAKRISLAMRNATTLEVIEGAISWLVKRGQGSP